MNKTIEHTAKVGDIFRMSWGYDQTNVDYFQVVGLTPKGVVVREIDHEKVEGTEGFMCSKVRPVPNKFSTLTMWVKDNVKGLVRKVGQSGGKLTTRGMLEETKIKIAVIAYPFAIYFGAHFMNWLVNL